MRATIVLNHGIGRTVRRQPAAIRVGDVLWTSGEFAAGERVHLTYCAPDGGQYAVATGVTRLHAAELRRRLPPTRASGGATARGDDATLLIEASDVQPLWP